jgi:hypothetical protein
MQNWNRLHNLLRRSSRFVEESMRPRVRSVRFVGDYRLELGFTDGLIKVVDFKDPIVGRGGVFRPLADIDFSSKSSLMRKRAQSSGRME